VTVLFRYPPQVLSPAPEILYRRTLYSFPPSSLLGRQLFYFDDLTPCPPPFAFRMSLFFVRSFSLNSFVSGYFFFFCRSFSHRVIVEVLFFRDGGPVFLASRGHIFSDLFLLAICHPSLRQLPQALFFRTMSPFLFT